jgi:hypothetical protein
LAVGWEDYDEEIVEIVEIDIGKDDVMRKIIKIGSVCFDQLMYQRRAKLNENVDPTI